jgi:uncharacterized protein
MYKADKESIYRSITEDLNLPRESVVNTVQLILAGGTVPFIARYRKEKTGNLDEVVIRNLRDKLNYYAELEKDKEDIIETIFSQGKLTEDLERKIVSCKDRQVLEDLYIPYKPKRRTKAVIAREQGLAPLAELVLKQEKGSVPREEIIKPFIRPEMGLSDAAQVIEGVVEILAENISEAAEIRKKIRDYFYENAFIAAKVSPEWSGKKSKFEMYYNFKERLKDSVSHRLLAIRRGTAEGVISWSLEVDRDILIQFIEKRIVADPLSDMADILRSAAKKAYIKIAVSVEYEIFGQFMEKAESEAIDVFAKNLRNLLLEPPAGRKVMVGVDPGERTGCKLAVIDECGHLLEHSTIYLIPPEHRKEDAARVLMELSRKYRPVLFAVGNGTASRETVFFIKDVLKKNKEEKTSVVEVSEAGASVYSASDAAREEFSDLDITIRGAVNIARRLQDPLAELVKIDPKAIGVGQYQHDVNQAALKKGLEEVVESCVNYVGVELNTASKELLSYVAGIGPFMASKIVEYRKTKGAFSSREEIRAIPMLGEKVFEQCAGFLRIRGSADPLDNSAIHPESYGIVERMAEDTGTAVKDLIANDAEIAKIDLKKYITPDVGIFTLEDIRKELLKPGLDPRSEFVNVEYRADIRSIRDLKRDMRLFGKVTNVTNFGAFVDIGVHQDGLVHISNLSRKFIKSPHEAVSVGDRVKVKVLSVDPELKRIDLEKL